MIVRSSVGAVDQCALGGPLYAGTGRETRSVVRPGWRAIRTPEIASEWLDRILGVGCVGEIVELAKVQRVGRGSWGSPNEENRPIMSGLARRARGIT